METLFTAYVTLDPKLQEVIALLITALVTFLILQVTAQLPWLGEYLGQYKVGIITWLTALVVQLVQAGLDKIPVEWDSIASLAMQLIAEVILLLLGFALYRRSKAKGYKALM